MLCHRLLLCRMAIVFLGLVLVQPLISSCSAFVGHAYRQGRTAATKFNKNIVCNPCTSYQATIFGPYSELQTIRDIVNRKRKRISSHQPTGRTVAAGTSTTQLMLHPTAGASLALVGSSLFGMQVSRWFPSGGILGTLLSAAFFGNILTKWIPNQHPLYDLCFTLFLPGSLTLLLLAYQPPKQLLDDKSNGNTAEKGVSRTTTGPSQHSIAACIRRIAMPFLITSLSSLVGCWLSYRCALAFRWFRECAGASSGAGKAASELARITTGCMSASYVGGSVNFVSTARLIGAPAELLGSLVTADLFTMAIYFSFLSSSLEWDWLVGMFSRAPAELSPTTDQGVGQSDALENASVTQQRQQASKVTDKNVPSSPSSGSTFPSNWRDSVYLASVPLLMATMFIVQIANRIEDFLGDFVPGTACAVIAVVAPLLNSLVQAKEFWTPFSKAASVWSDFFFLSFFASIGVAANLSSALSMGPACLLFSAIALTVHVFGTVIGCILWKKIIFAIDARFRRDQKSDSSPPSLDLEDVWIASNAAIGGPATAAAFCGQMKKRDPGKLQGRTISATVWGVVGYAIGTMIGVGMYRIV